MTHVTRLAKLSIVLPLALCTGCEQQKIPEPPQVEVSVARPVVRDVSKYVIFSGNAQASQVFEARARVEGYLRPLEGEQKWSEGDEVQEGDLLFIIEREPYQNRLELSQAKHAQAAAAEELASNTLRRARSLREKDAIPEQELEQREAEFKVAQADTQRAQVEVDQAQIDLGYTEIRAPFSGRTSERFVDEGNIVGVGENTLLTTVRKIKPMHVYFDLSERIVLDVMRKLAENPSDAGKPFPIEVQFEGENGFPHKGFLEVLDNQIDPTTGTSLVRGSFPNERELITPGAFARVRVIPEGIDSAVLVDERAIGTDLAGKYLLVVDTAGEVSLRRVHLGQLYSGFRHITALWDPAKDAPDENDEDPPPVDPDFRYVLLGVQRARPGQTVKVTAELETPFPEDDESIPPSRPDEDAQPETGSQTDDGSTNDDSADGPGSADQNSADPATNPDDGGQSGGTPSEGDNGAASGNGSTDANGDAAASGEGDKNGSQ